jgi:hypothetical protein
MSPSKVPLLFVGSTILPLAVRKILTFYHRSKGERLSLGDVLAPLRLASLWQVDSLKEPL